MRNDLQRKQRDEIIRRENALFDLELENQKAKQRARAMGQQERNNIDYIAETGKEPTNASNPSSNNNHNKHLSKWIIVIIAVLITVVLLFFFGGKSKTQDESHGYKTQNQASGNTLANNHTPQQSNGRRTEFIDGCIFPNSSSCYLTKADIDAIEGIGEYTRLDIIQFAINELYARHHATFTTEIMRQHYSSCSWYIDKGIDPETVILDPIEDYNLKLLTDARSEERDKEEN